MNKRNIVSIVAGMLVFSTPALAKTVEVKMLNKGAAGSMVFEPAFVQAGVGDTVHFVLVDKGHNATPIAGMTPAGTQPAKGAFNQDYKLTLTKPGLYGIECTPHVGFGMVALVKAGSGPAPNYATAAAAADKLPPLARKRMTPMLSRAR